MDSVEFAEKYPDYYEWWEGYFRSIVFVHIPRTGGTALAQALTAAAQAAGDMAVLSKDDIARVADMRTFSSRFLVHGHIVLDQEHWSSIIADEQYKTITVLRDPVDRLISLYYRFKLDAGYPFHAELQTMSLADFVASGQLCQTYQANNDQVRRLSGKDFSFGDNCWCAVDEAMRNLESFTVVGVYGWLGHLRRAIRERVRLALPPLPRVSVDLERPTVGQLDPVDLEAIQEYNQLDFALYSMATERVAEDLHVWAQAEDN